MFGTLMHRMTTLKELGSILKTGSNRFAVYEAQHTFVRLMTEERWQEGITVIKELLSDTDDPQLLLRTLEVYRHLLSNKSPSYIAVLAQLNPDLLRSFTLVLITDSVFFTELLIHEVLVICLKLVKLVVQNLTENSDVAMLVLTFLNENDVKLVNILFLQEVKHFVKRKLLTVLSYLLECYSPGNVFANQKELLNLTSVLYENIRKCNLEQILSQLGHTCFIGHIETSTGRESIEAEDDCRLDIVHIRQWTYLCMCVAAALQCDTGLPLSLYSPLSLLSKVDGIVKKLLNCGRPWVLPWLPEVYGDQDDVWVKVLLLLVDVFSCSAEMSKHLHVHFLQFVGMLGYDDLVLVDLLTSPETKFREYIVKYLKFLSETWEEFRHAFVYIDVSNRTSDKSRCVEQEDNIDALTVHHRTSDEQHRKHQHMALDQSTCKHFINESSTKKSISRDKILTNMYDSVENLHTHETSNSNVVGEESVYTKCGETCDSLCSVTGNATGSSTGLSMIMGAYDDDDDDDDDNDDDDDDDDNCGDSSECKKDNVDKSSFLQTPCSKSTSGFETNQADVGISDSCKSVKHQTHTSIKDILNTDKDDVNTLEINTESPSSLSSEDILTQNFLPQSESYSTELGIGCINPAHQGDIGLSLSTSLVSTQSSTDLYDEKCASMLDQVMSMLIRVRLKLERLSAADLLPFNPQVLTALLENVESKYEDEHI